MTIMRLFFAIKPDEKAVTEMDKFRSNLISFETPVKWIPEQLFHITLLFVGEIHPTGYRQLVSVIHNYKFNTPQFNLKIKGCGTFKRKGIPEIYWYGIDSPKEVAKLRSEILSTIPSSFKPENSFSFYPHITIGRNRKSFLNSRFSQKLEKLKNHIISEFTVNSIYLVESILKHEGPTYIYKHEIPLGKKLNAKI